MSRFLFFIVHVWARLSTTHPRWVVARNTVVVRRVTTWKVAERCAFALGIDKSEKQIKSAKERFVRDNLVFAIGDALVRDQHVMFERTWFVHCARTRGVTSWGGRASITHFPILIDDACATTYDRMQGQYGTSALNTALGLDSAKLITSLLISLVQDLSGRSHRC